MEEDREGNQLLVKARAGDRASFDALIGRLDRRVRAFVRARIRPDSRSRLDLDEIVQDTFVRAFMSLSCFRGDDVASFARWLLGIARIALIKAASPPGGKELVIETDVAKSGVSPSGALRREERFDRLEAAMGSLSADHREILFLVRMEGLSMKDAAERMGRSPAAARKLFGRALQKLQARFGDTESLHLPDRELLRDGEDHES